MRSSSSFAAQGLVTSAYNSNCCSFLVDISSSTGRKPIELMDNRFLFISIILLPQGLLM